MTDKKLDELAREELARHFINPLDKGRRRLHPDAPFRQVLRVKGGKNHKALADLLCSTQTKEKLAEWLALCLLTQQNYAHAVARQESRMQKWRAGQARWGGAAAAPMREAKEQARARFLELQRPGKRGKKYRTNRELAAAICSEFPSLNPTTIEKKWIREWRRAIEAKPSTSNGDPG